MKTTREQAKKEFEKHISDLIEQFFPKGRCKERAEALILMALVTVQAYKHTEHLLDKEREVERDKTATKILSMMSSLKYQRTWSQNVWTKLRKKISTLKPKEKPTKKQSADYVKKNFGDVIKRLAKE